MKFYDSDWKVKARTWAESDAAEAKYADYARDALDLDRGVVLAGL